jgi:hypothetical protein
VHAKGWRRARQRRRRTAAARRSFAGEGGPGATVHQNACDLDREEEENGAKLTRCSMTAVGRWRGHRGRRGGRCGAGERRKVLRFGEKIKGGGGELAHRRGNELETAWALGKRRWRRSTSASGGRRRRRCSVHGSVGGEEKSSGTPGPRASGADVGRRRGGTRDLFTGGGERRMAGDGAAAGFPGGGACA